MNFKAFFSGFIGLLVVSAVTIFAMQLNSSPALYEAPSSNISAVNFAMLNYFTIYNDSVVDAVSDFIYDDHSCNSGSNWSESDLQDKINSYIGASTSNFNSTFTPIQCQSLTSFSQTPNSIGELEIDSEITCSYSDLSSSVEITKSFSLTKNVVFTNDSTNCTINIIDKPSANVDLSLTEPSP